MTRKSISATIQFKSSVKKPNKDQELVAIILRLPERLKTLHAALGAGEWNYRCPPYIYITNFSNMLRWLADQLDIIAEEKRRNNETEKAF